MRAGKCDYPSHEDAGGSCYVSILHAERQRKNISRRAYRLFLLAIINYSLLWLEKFVV